MPEAGGPTTQSGILYQNSVTALYLGRLCDVTPRIDRERVVRVRVEAPAAVDDTVVHYADGRVAYVQAKESVRQNDEAWRKLWRDFAAQFRSDDFRQGRDCLRLHLGDSRAEYFALREACKRADAPDVAEWHRRMNVEQRRVTSAIGEILGPVLPGGDIAVHAFFSHVEVEVWPSEHLEADWAPLYMPVANMPRETIFRLLRDRVGGKARVRGTFEARTLRKNLADEDKVEFRAAPDLAVLRAAVRECGALLRQHKSTLGGTGVHLPRAVTDDIVAWALDPAREDSAAMLLDSAGAGKTVVMRDVLAALEERGATVLAVKADQQLSAVEGPDGMQRALRLPEPVEQVVGRLAVLGPTVVIVDQVDALSLSLARDQRALDWVLGLVARLRELPGVAVLLSCRTFDRNTDPRLNRLDAGRVFPLPALGSEEVDLVLAALGVERKSLTPATQELLRTPLHLDLFARVVQAAGAGADQVRGIRTLQDLYALLWDEVVLQPLPHGPTSSARTRALRAMVGRMDREQRTSVPRPVAPAEGGELTAAAEWLASAGILVPGREEWALLHQTFFDYCYARFFVEDGRALAEHVLGSDQGLFVRPQLVQVLSFLRGTRNPLYLQEVSELLAAGGLRRHLRELLLRWMGALDHPTDGEWLLARRLLADPAIRPRFLKAMSENPDWLPRVRSGPLKGWLAGDAPQIDDEVLPYLSSLADGAPGEIAEIAAPWIDHDEMVWQRRIRWLLWMVRAWHPPLVGLYERYLRGKSLVDLGECYAVGDIAKVDPPAGSRLVRIVFDAILSAYRDRIRDDETAVYRGIMEDIHHTDTHAVERAIEFATSGSPRAFLDSMLPWLEHAVASVATSASGAWRTRHPGDALSTGGGVSHDDLHDALTKGFVRALVGLASEDVAAFRATSERLAALPYVTPQCFLARAYHALAPALAGDALDFLLGDPRRLDLGDYSEEDTLRLLGAISPALSDEQLGRLEDFILSHSGRLEPRYDHKFTLRYRGRDQLFLLQAMPRDRLTPRGRRRLQELERKFPGVVPVQHPRAMVAMSQGAPIGADGARRMSDSGWLGAMAKYARGVEHRNDRKGGARELSHVLKARVKEEPARFYALAQRTPDDLDHAYVEAFVDGLVETDAPAEWIFVLVRRFAPRSWPDLRRWMSWTLEKVVAKRERLPPDLIEMLGAWVRRPAGEDERRWEEQREDPFTGTVNTERGAALHTLLRALAAEPGEDALEARWGWMEYAASDPSAILRAGAMQALAHLIEKDHDRAVGLFRRLADGMPRLRESRPFHDFLYWAAWKHFESMAPYVEEVMQSGKAESRKRGAELAVLARISTRSLESDAALAAAERLCEKAMTGPADWRSGAARVLSHNLVGGPTELCEPRLRRLLNDEDKSVRQEVAWFVHRLNEEHVSALGPFLAEFAGSRCYRQSPYRFGEYLWENGPLDPVWALGVVETILDNPHPTEQHADPRGGEELVRLVLRVYTDPMSTALRARSMDAFERLMEIHSGYAWRALEEWDRR